MAPHARRGIASEAGSVLHLVLSPVLVLYLVQQALWEQRRRAHLPTCMTGGGRHGVGLRMDGCPQTEKNAHPRTVPTRLQGCFLVTEGLDRQRRA